MNNYSKMYRRYLKHFSIGTKDLFKINTSLLESFTRNPEKISDQVSTFISISSKIALHSNSILEILPKDDPRNLCDTPNFKSIDLSSVASLTRDIIDADNMLFYLFMQEIDPIEQEFRILLYRLHGYFRQRDFLSLTGGPNQNILASINNKIDELIQQLAENGFYKNLEIEISGKTSRGERAKKIFKQRNGKIENLKDSVFLTRKEITDIRQIDTSEFEALYMFLSAHVHSFAMGTSLIGSAVTLEDKGLLFLLKTIEYASFY